MTPAVVAEPPTSPVSIDIRAQRKLDEMDDARADSFDFYDSILGGLSEDDVRTFPRRTSSRPTPPVPPADNR
jgi:hypothetical protein